MEGARFVDAWFLGAWIGAWLQNETFDGYWIQLDADSPFRYVTKIRERASKNKSECRLRKAALREIKQLIAEITGEEIAREAEDILHRKYGSQWIVTGNDIVDASRVKLHIDMHRLPPREDLRDVAELLDDYGLRAEPDRDDGSITVSLK